MKKNQGFSLLELLIVVAIILIIATIAVPSLLHSRRNANETAAVANLRMVNTAQANYSVTGGGSFADLSELVSQGLLDSGFLSVKSGYAYSIDLSANHLDYTAHAIATTSVMGRYDYYAQPDYVVRFSSVTGRSPTGLEGQSAQ